MSRLRTRLLRTRLATRPRGAALLIVLVTLTLVTAAAAALLRVASTEHARRSVHDRVELAIDVAGALDAPIRHWLHTKSAEVVLPPDVAAPFVLVLHDQWIAGDHAIEIRVTAFDQCGMAPHTIARSGSPLRLVLPADVTRHVDSVTLPRDVPAGLDQFALAHERPSGSFVFPVVTGGLAIAFGSGDAAAAAGSEPAEPASVTGTALGALVATHNPGQINVMTAPMPLVEAAMRLAGRGDVDRVLAAREAGERIDLTAPARRAREDRAIPRIVTSSSVWSFRVDVRVGSAARSWWAVYERAAGNQWRCVQRLAIHE